MDDASFFLFEEDKIENLGDDQMEAIRENIRSNTATYDLDTVKLMIEMAYSFDEADDVVREHIGSDETEKKLSFLLGNYEFSIASSSVAEVDRGSEALIMYEAVLKTIISRKWR